MRTTALFTFALSLASVSADVFGYQPPCAGLMDNLRNCCTPLQTLDNGVCCDPKTLKSTYCVSGLIDNSGMCCGPMQTLDNGVCCDPKTLKSTYCVSGLVDNSGMCCGPMQTLDNGVCCDPKTLKSTYCVSGLVDNSGMCCGPMQTLDNGVCCDPKTLKSTYCVSGLVDNSGNCCGPLQTLDYGVCCDPKPSYTIMPAMYSTTSASPAMATMLYDMTPPAAATAPLNRPYETNSYGYNPTKYTVQANSAANGVVGIAGVALSIVSFVAVSF